jgi:hypothetical protein
LIVFAALLRWPPGQRTPDIFPEIVTHPNGEFPVILRLRRYAAAAPFLLLLLLAAGCAVRSPSASFDFEKLKEDVEKRARLVSRFRVDFVKTRRTAMFNRPMSVKGRLIFQRPDKFRMTASGDVNVEVLSNGRILELVHDGTDREIYELHGDRDVSRFTDPLMALLYGMGNGAIRNMSLLKGPTGDEPAMLEVKPGTSGQMDKDVRAYVWFSEGGDLRKVRFVFPNGDEDETLFLSWALLPANDPEIVDLERRLEELQAHMSEVRNEES